MKNLVKELTKQTQDLRTKYIAETKIYAKVEFDKNVELSKLNVYYLGETFGFKTELHADERAFGSKSPQRRFSKIDNLHFYNHKASLKLDRLQTKIANISNMGLEKFTSKEVKKAEDHYTHSIEKLAHRIIKKGLDLNNIKMKSSFLDPNMSTTITDDVKTVRAFTIIASGAVQKPHYRYLIK